MTGLDSTQMSFGSTARMSDPTRNHDFRLSSSSSPRPGKRRCSRVGTRSVNTLTPAQLERKRANDREAQRAIRQRTKETVEKLERNVGEYHSRWQAADALSSQYQKRIRELEEENAYLRNQLHCTSFTIAKSFSSSTTYPRPDDIACSETSAAPLTLLSLGMPNIPSERPHGTHPTISNIVTHNQYSAFHQRSWQQSLIPSDSPSQLKTQSDVSTPATLPNDYPWKVEVDAQSIHSDSSCTTNQSSEMQVHSMTPRFIIEPNGWSYDPALYSQFPAGDINEQTSCLQARLRQANLPQHSFANIFGVSDSSSYQSSLQSVPPQGSGLTGASMPQPLAGDANLASTSQTWWQHDQQVNTFQRARYQEPTGNKKPVMVYSLTQYPSG